MNQYSNSIDLYRDLEFFIDHINVEDGILSLLLSDQVAISSLSDLYRRSQDFGWLKSLIEERNKLKLDQKSKPKRLILNRWIFEYSQNPTEFDNKLHQFNEKVKRQMFNTVALPKTNENCLLTIQSAFLIIEEWKQRQCQRRLFDRPCDDLHSFLTLQAIMTNRFLELINLAKCDPHFLENGGHAEFIELFRYSTIIVTQPSGTDCIAVTKYEKVGNEYLAKIKTRIICLLDLKKIQSYLQYSDVDVVLYPTERSIDPLGDPQPSIPWKTRTILINEYQKQTFFYAELTENDFLYLTKTDSHNKLLYNHKLCELEFRIALKILDYNIETILVMNSQSFGLCSHSKYYPRHLAKVFIEELSQWHKDINPDTHINLLQECIGQFYKRMTGVAAKSHTLQVIEQALNEVYNSYLHSMPSSVTHILIHKWTIYQNILEKLFTQIKFLSGNQYLALMYHDSLFYGISNDEIDIQLNGSSQAGTQIIMRFINFKQQESTQYPNIIFGFHDGILRRARTDHEYLIDDISNCIDLACNRNQNHRHVFGGDQIISFQFFQAYYDKDLNRDNHIQEDEQATFYPLRTLLQNTTYL